MTNLERLKLELAHKDYFTDTDYTYNKAENQLDWIRQMNVCVAQAEGTIKSELIYAD